ncbi:MAG: hypothetical protein WBQ94_08885, partial [Terracidiphilus sp.]
MSSSFIRYRGYGFWSDDRFAESLADEVALSISARHEGESWLAELGAHWKLQASGPFRGWMDLLLDDFLTTDERRKELCRIVREVANQHAIEDPIHETGALLGRLLDGEISWTASSPLDYM